MHNKKLNIYVYFLVVLLYYLIFELLTSYTLGPFASIIRYSKYGFYIITEVCWLTLVLLAIFLFKGGKIFANKKEGLLKTLYICFPLTFISIVYTVGNFRNLLGAPIINIVGLIIYAFTIGLTEELLVRGWILNRFFNKYNKRKEVYLSIFFSALIFGGMHIANIWTGGQTIPQTLLQVLFATAAGIFFGAAYFRTKNIIGMAIVHGFYDFSILIGEINYFRDCTTTDVSSIARYQMVLTLGNCLILLLSAIIIMRKSQTNSSFGEEVTPIIESKDKELKSKAIIACIIIYFVTNNVPLSFFGVTTEDLKNYQKCYYYPEINMNNVETSYNNYTEYTIKNENVSYHFLNDNSKLVLIVDKKKYQLAKDIIDFKIINNNNKYTIYYLIKEEKSSNTTIFYSTYLDINSLSKDEKYIKAFKKSFTKQGLPPSNTLGAIKEVGYEHLFPLVKDYNNNILLIDENNVVRRITIDKSSKGDLIILQEKNKIEQLKKELYEIIPFKDYKSIDYLDVYQENNTTIDNIDTRILLNNSYKLSNKEEIELSVYSDNCFINNPCQGNAYVNNLELINKLKTLYNKDVNDITSFNMNNGIVELNNDYWIYFNKNDSVIERISIIEDAYLDDEDFIIEEKAGFIYNDMLSKYSEIDNSIITNNGDKEELKRYFKSHQKDFSTFTHTFKYDKEANRYFYYSTSVNK